MPSVPDAKSPFVLRPYRSTDAAFVYSSWLHAYRPSAPVLVKETYYREQHRLISALIAAPEESRTVATAPDDDSHLFGFCFGARARLDYVFVKPMYRHLGICRALLTALGPVAAYTHPGSLAPEGAEFNPYLLFYLPAPD